MSSPQVGDEFSGFGEDAEDGRSPISSSSPMNEAPVRLIVLYDNIFSRLQSFWIGEHRVAEPLNAVFDRMVFSLRIWGASAEVTADGLDILEDHYPQVASAINIHLQNVSCALLDVERENSSKSKRVDSATLSASSTELTTISPSIQALKDTISDSMELTEPIQICLSVYRSSGAPSRIESVVAREDVKNGQPLLHHIESVDQTLEDQIRSLSQHYPSFRDFLLSCGDPQFRVNEEEAHRQMAYGCIRLMSTALKQDICDQYRPGVLVNDVESVRVEECLPPEVQYACLNWVQHLQQCGDGPYDSDGIYQFLQVHLLHWFEALSWMRKIAEGTRAIISLEAITLNIEYHDISAFIQDTRKFAIYNKRIIQQAPLQIYFSALAFAPMTSIVRKNFENRVPRWIQRLPNIPRDWSALLQTLEDDNKPVTAVAFSPDSQLLASASRDRTIRPWDPKTGATVQTLESYPAGGIIAMAFSPDGQLLASASDDMMVRMWDPKTGSIVQTLKGHAARVTIVIFSPDGELLASASHDGTVRLWDPKTGVMMQTLKIHTSQITSMTFSSSGQLLASASYDGMVRLCDLKTGAIMQTLKGHTVRITAMAFSFDGQLLASTFWHGTIRLLNPKTGAIVQTLKGHSGLITAVAFSPNGQLFASASNDGTVRLWDPKRGTMVKALEVDAVVRALSFTVNGPYLKTDRGLIDGTIPVFPSGEVLSCPALPCGIFVKEEWIAQGKENLLWLPFDYRSTGVAVREGVVALSNASSGHISFLEFALP